MEHITLNPLYVLKPDEGRALIMATLVGRNSLEEFNDSFSNIIHPIYAMILSYIDGREFQDCINEAADELGVSYELVEGFVKGLLNKSEQIYIKNGELTSAFPPNTIISIPEKIFKKDMIRNYLRMTK